MCYSDSFYVLALKPGVAVISPQLSRIRPGVCRVTAGDDTQQLIHGAMVGGWPWFATLAHRSILLLPIVDVLLFAFFCTWDFGFLHARVWPFFLTERTPPGSCRTLPGSRLDKQKRSGVRFGECPTRLDETTSRQLPRYRCRLSSPDVPPNREGLGVHTYPFPCAGGAPGSHGSLGSFFLPKIGSCCHHLPLPWYLGR